MASLRFTETARGIAYSIGTVTIEFPFGIGPVLVLRNGTYKIEKPERFGTYDTPKARRAYVRAFVAHMATLATASV